MNKHRYHTSYDARSVCAASCGLLPGFAQEPGEAIPLYWWVSQMVRLEGHLYLGALIVSPAAAGTVASPHGSRWCELSLALLGRQGLMFPSSLGEEPASHGIGRQPIGPFRHCVVYLLPAHLPPLSPSPPRPAFLASSNLFLSLCIQPPNLYSSYY